MQGSRLMAQPLSGTMSDMCNGCLTPQCEGIDALGIIPHGDGHVFESARGWSPHMCRRTEEWTHYHHAGKRNSSGKSVLAWWMWYLYRYSYVYDKDGQFTYRIFMDTVITGKPYCGITRSPWDLQIRKQTTLGRGWGRSDNTGITICQGHVGPEWQ